MPRRLLRILVAGAFLAAFFAGQLVPGTSPPAGTDKELHVAAYFALALVAWWVLEGPPLRRAALVLAGGALLGALVEVAQGHVPGRHADPKDFQADLVGLGAAVAALLVGAWTSRIAPLAPASAEAASPAPAEPDVAAVDAEAATPAAVDGGGESGEEAAAAEAAPDAAPEAGDGDAGRPG